MKNKWNVLLINSKRSDPNYYICLQIRNALKQHGDVESVVLADYSNAATIVQGGRFNLLFVYGGESINQPVVQVLKRACGNAIVWFTEDPYELNNNIHSSELFDLVFTNDPGSVADYPHTAFFLPLASSEEFHFFPVPENDDAYRYDLSFIGTAWPNRTKMIEALMQAKPEFKYKLALPTNEHLPKFKLPIPESEINWRTPNTELAKIANNSRFSLILHREFSASGNKEKAESPGPRLFEIAMAGGLLLVDDSIELNSDLFSPGTEYLPFKNLKECLTQIEYYADKPHERKKIIEAAQQRAIQYHTYDQRINSLFEKVNAKLSPEASKLPDLDQKENKKLLIVVHNVVNVQPFGGVEVYVDSILKKLKDDYDIYFYIPNKQKDQHKSYAVLDAEYNLIEEVDFSFPINGNWLSEPERESRFFDLLVKYKIDIVHYHHFLDQIPSLPLISKVLGIKSIISIHDYYFICDSFNLYNEKHQYCDVRNRSIESCDLCASKRVGFVRGAIQKRRTFYERALKNADVVLGYSETTKAYHQSIFKGLDNIQITPLPTTTMNQNRPESKQTEKFMVAILGNFSAHKGADLYLDIFKYMADENVEFHLYGKMNDHYSHVLDSWNLKNVFVHKEYAVSELNVLLKDKNLSLHLSTWPETFLLTLSESWDNGLVPIVSDIGALGERVTDGVDGFIVPVNDSGAVVHIIRRLMNDIELYKTIFANVQSLKLTNFDEHIEFLEKIYDSPHVSKTEERVETQSNISLQDLSRGPVVNYLEQIPEAVSPPAAIAPVVLEVDSSHVENKYKRNLKKVYHYYQIYGLKLTCKRILAEVRKRTFK